MHCELNQLSIFDMIKEQENNVLFSDILHDENGNIINSKENMIFNGDYDCGDTWYKQLKDGSFIYHQYRKPKPRRPMDVELALNELKRRFVFGLFLNTGNPNWQNVDEFKKFLIEYGNLTDKAALTSMICGKWCKKCNKKTKIDDSIEAKLLRERGMER